MKLTYIPLLLDRFLFLIVVVVLLMGMNLSMKVKEHFLQVVFFLIYK